MIKGLAGGPGVVVDGGSTSLPWTSQNASDAFGGVLRISGGDIQYYSNGTWISLASSYATVRLDPSTESVIKWARDKQAMEASEKASRDYMIRRAAEFPSLEKALQAVERAEGIHHQVVKDAIANFHLMDKIAGQSNDNSPDAMQS